MEFEEPRAAACEVELLAHAHQTPSTTFVVGQGRPSRVRCRDLRCTPDSRRLVPLPKSAALGQRTKSLCDRGSLSACVLTRLEIVDSGAWRPVLRIEVLSTSSKTGVSHEYGYRQPAASAHDRGHERAQA